jgi:hypothetical protein
MVVQKKIHAPGMRSDQFGIRFKMFLIVELTKLGGQNIKLDLYFWKIFSFENERSFGTATLNIIEQPILIQK